MYDVKLQNYADVIKGELITCFMKCDVFASWHIAVVTVQEAESIHGDTTFDTPEQVILKNHTVQPCKP